MENAIISGIRLASQQLSGTKMQTPKDIVSWMGAIQAQDYNMAKWAIGLRLPGFTNRMVENAFNNGDFLRTHVMRPTWHFVSPENIRWMLVLTGPKIKSSTKSRDRNLEITEELYGKTNDILQKVLEGNKHLTREELGKEFEKSKITVNSSRLVHFMMRAELDGILCSGAMRGKSHTYALLDERVPASKTLLKEEALAKLALIYFESHCPATLQDFIWWSGLSATEARSGLEMIKINFISEKIGDQTYWFADVFSNFSSPGQSFHLLPAFDEYIISYKDRKAVLDSGNHSKAISSNGIFRPTIAVNGQVAGLWKKSTTKKQPVVLDYFKQPDFPERELEEQAIRAFKTFIG